MDKTRGQKSRVTVPLGINRIAKKMHYFENIACALLYVI